MCLFSCSCDLAVVPERLPHCAGQHHYLQCGTQSQPQRKQGCGGLGHPSSMERETGKVPLLKVKQKFVPRTVRCIGPSCSRFHRCTGVESFSNKCGKRCKESTSCTVFDYICAQVLVGKVSSGRSLGLCCKQLRLLFL